MGGIGSGRQGGRYRLTTDRVLGIGVSYRRPLNLAHRFLATVCKIVFEEGRGASPRGNHMLQAGKDGLTLASVYTTMRG